jgi:SnoaL-like domain
MTSDISELMHRSLFRVFGERDPERRKAAIAETYSEDVIFNDPEGTITGRAALDEKVQGLLDSAPGFTFQPGGDVRESANLGLLPWTFGPETGPPVTTGMDIVIVRDGLIAMLYTLVDS